MRGDQIAAVDGCRHGSAHLQRRDGHGLAECRGGQLHLTQLIGRIILHQAGLAGQVHAGALGKAKGVKIIVELLGAHALAQLDVVEVAALAQSVGHVDGAVGLVACAVVGLLGHAVGTGTGKGGVHGRHAGVQTHGRGDDLEHTAGVVQLGDGLVLPQDIAVGAGIIRVRVHDLVAVFVQLELLRVVFVPEVDGVQLRLCGHLLLQVGQVGAVIQRRVGVKVRFGGHGQDRTGLDVHHDGTAAVLDVVGRNGLRQVAFHDLLHVHVQRQHQIGAVLGGKGGGVLVGNGVAHRVAPGDGAAIHTGQRGLVGFFQAVGAHALAVGKAQHGSRKGSVGVVALRALFRRDGHPPDAVCAGALFVRLVETGHIILNGQLDGVVHLGGQHHIGGINFGQCIVHGLVLPGVFLRGSVHRVQTLAVAGEQPQGDALADLGAHGRVKCAHRRFIVVGAGGVQDAAVAGVSPDVPHHAGGSQRNAVGVVDLAAGGLDRGVQQLLLGGILSVLGTVPDLDDIQAVDDHGRCQHDRRQPQNAAHAPGASVEPFPRKGRAHPVAFALFLVGILLHAVLPQTGRSTRSACCFLQDIGPRGGCPGPAKNRKSVRCRTLSRFDVILRCPEWSRHRCR